MSALNHHVTKQVAMSLDTRDLDRFTRHTHVQNGKYSIITPEDLQLVAMHCVCEAVTYPCQLTS